MTNLADKKCIPCEGGIPGFDITEIHKYLKMVDADPYYGIRVKANKSAQIATLQSENSGS